MQKRRQGVQAKFLDKKRLFLTYPQWKGDDTKEFVLESLQKKTEELGLLIVQYVIGRELHQDGNIHFHAFIKLDASSNKRGSDLLDINENHPNIQPVKSEKNVINYVQKHGDFITNIESKDEQKLKQKSQRTIICEEIINNHRTPQSLVHEYPSMLYDLEKYIKNTNMFRLLSAQQTPTPKTKGIWIYGEPGVGKTRGVRAFYEQKGISVYSKPQSKWWCGYTGQQVALLDDFDFHGLHHNLKIWADHYAESGETKGGNVPLLFKYFVITSNKSIDELFCDDPIKGKHFTEDDRDAIRRRFVVHHMHKGFPFPSLPLDNFDVLPPLMNPATAPGGLASGVSLPSHVLQKLSEIVDSDEDIQ